MSNPKKNLAAKKKKSFTSQELAEGIQQLMDQKKAEDIRLFDLNGRSSIADFMLIATTTSLRHATSLAADIDFFAHEHQVSVRGVEGLPEGSGWVLMDLGDVIVHLFLREVRDFYNLEKIWDAERWIQENRQSGGDIQDTEDSPSNDDESPSD
ncbi:MAG: ribosome silencing factor [Magnetococcus sp. DMHC-6]